MLDDRKIPFDDIKLVVTALAERRLELDYARYYSPYDLHRDGNWEYALSGVKLAIKRQEMVEANRRMAMPRTPQPKSAHRSWQDFLCEPEPEDSQVTACDLSKNTQQRHRRYLAKASHRHHPGRRRALRGLPFR